MEGPFPGVMNQADREEPGGGQAVIQQYARYPAATLEPALPSASSVESARSRVAASKSPPLQRRETPRSLQASPTGQRLIIHRESSARSGPSMSPPVFTNSLRHSQSRESMDRAESRSLPTRDITDDNIDDAYVAFIFYCNPNVPDSADTTELRKTFRSPPRSDGKSFSIFNLWELIRKLDNKELKTWIQLAIELGVEPPSTEKKQSTQKVQQYAVRLKRWMRAMRVDAFFEFCLGHPHPYYVHLPSAHSHISDVRDGVALEEDLAIRALVPQWKPKRGRKRTEDRGIDEEKPTKRPQLDTSVGVLHGGSFPSQSTTFPHSAIPFSAFPDDMEHNDPWMAAASSFPADAPNVPQGHGLRWRPLERDASPAGYPQSAVIPRAQHSSDAFPPVEPQSAVTPLSVEKARARRRHGPAVSSAWPGSNGLSTGKTRGRPPNRGTVSGPFSSFPVNPARDESTHDSSARPVSAVPLEHNVFDQFPASQHSQSPNSFEGGSRPGKLQLQVPQHPGGPVRLATPPTLLVNGVTNTESPKSDGNASGPISHQIPGASTNPSAKYSPEKLTSEDVVRLLSDELLRARVIGRPSALGPDEARGLAASVVRSLKESCSHSEKSNPAFPPALHLGLGSYLGLKGATSGSMVVTVEREPQISGYIYTLSHEYNYGPNISTRVVYNNLRLLPSGDDKPHDQHATDESSLNSNAVEDPGQDPDSLSDAEFEMDSVDNNSGVSDGAWKQRYLRLRSQMQKKEKALSQYKRKILESVMEEI